MKLSTGYATLWLIPARGGSKGIPDKNIKPFCGESLVSRSIKLAKQAASHQDIIFVSTDSQEIKSEAIGNGIEIPFMRPDELASDSSSTYDAMIHAINEFSSMGHSFQRIVLLQPTSPFRTLEDIKNAVALWSPDIDMVVSVKKSNANPYFNLFEINKDGFLHLSKGDGSCTRRQDAPDVWEYNGAVYVITVDSLLKSTLARFKKIVPYEMPTARSIDLDTPEDWEIAEIIYKNLNLLAQR